MSKYGLNLRPKKKQPARPPFPKPRGFGEDDENDVEKEISRHASKNKSLKDIEEQQRKALEQDPSVFDYDGVYDEMKQQTIQPQAQDREERRPRYIELLMEKAKERNREHEIVYERKLAKERSQEDHLYAGKDKFVTIAYKRKLAEQEKWMEEERRRQLREENDDVTKKKDLTDFYYNLGKNVAFGAEDVNPRKVERPAILSKPEKDEDKPVGVASEPLESSRVGERQLEKPSESGKPEKYKEIYVTSELLQSPKVKEGHEEGTSTMSESGVEPCTEKEASKTSAQEILPVEQRPEDKLKSNHHKRSEDALAAAKERYLARKRAKVQ